MNGNKKKKKKLDKGAFGLMYVFPFIIALLVGLWLWLLNAFLWSK